MASVKDLRERSRVSKELREQRVKRIQDAVNSIMDSDTMRLTILSRLGNVDEVNSNQIEAISQEISHKLVYEATDPVKEFEDMCSARGKDEEGIHDVVQMLSKVFNLEVDGSYENKEEAVALYLQQNHHLYDDIGVLI